jgi:hypothetical protein
MPDPENPRTLQEPAWRFQAMKIDPLFQRLEGARASSRNSSSGNEFTGRQVSLRAALIGVLLFVIAALADGRLLASGEAAANVRPALDSLLTSIPGFFSSSPARMPDFPLFADTASWLFLLASVMTFGLLFRQWTIMADVVPSLIECGAIEVEEENRFLGLLKRLNRIMGSWWATVVLLVLALGITVLVDQGLAQNGLYETLAPPDSNHGEWAREAYRHWWAGAGSDLGRAAFDFVLFAYLYYLLAQYFAGAIWVALTYFGKGHVKFGFDRSNMDGYFGWRPLRDLMLTVYLSILVQVLAMLPLLHLLTQGSWIYLVGPFLLFVVFNPIYILTPLILVSPDLRERRQEYLLHIADGEPSSQEASERSFKGHAQMAEVYGYVRSMPIFPIRGRDLGVGVVTYVIPIIALIWHR